ncbi:hypothetical protein DJ021_13890 [Phenylobacterium hankyongense]|uniref:Uncharacterized protein n=1 Tax=Phenylobacterium hankyongense TaxID=1813876 RepID=A0A328B0A4_9CAUL|nr:hypothetical protein [Phenylobacterium hankyongense]RAK60822.1 hypothetical protein DJ021_13890 [Phenylobacterium hankyongense]
MRIALCLSGQPRTWRFTRDSLFAFFAGHELDVFLHTWREGDPAELEALEAAYSPRATRFEARPAFVDEKRLMAAHFPIRPPLSVLDMFHAVARSLELALTRGGAPYDLVVRARYDAVFDGVWSGEAPEPGALILPNDFPYDSGCNDQLAIGSPTDMAAYGGLSAWLPGFLQGEKGDGFCPEIVLRNYLEAVCRLRVDLRPIAMRLLREAQAGLPFAAIVDDPLFHAEKQEAWEAEVEVAFPELAGHVNYNHPARRPLALDRALSAWLESRPPQAGFELLRAPWPRRLKAVEAFIVEQAGEIPEMTEVSYQGVRMICAMLLQRMDRAEPLSPESFLVHVLSANQADLQRAGAWGQANAGPVEDALKVCEPDGPLALALRYAPPLEQPAFGAWRP